MRYGLAISHRLSERIRTSLAGLIGLAAVTTCVTVPMPAWATTWHVPGDAATIQEGIDLTSPGDEVLVGPGEYYEHDIVMRPGIVVRGEQGPSMTVVDASDEGVGFICTDLSQASTIEGFSIRNGYAEGAGGGGIRSVASVITIRDCVLSDCDARADGGGIYASDSDVDLDGCRIEGCSAGFAGGGIRIQSWNAHVVRISDCDISNNRSTAGGGIVAGALIELSILSCRVAGNYVNGWNSGGIECMSPSLVIRDCVIVDNRVVGLGGGAGLTISTSHGSVEGCTIAANPVGYNAVAVSSSDIDFHRNIVAFNAGDGLACLDASIAIRCCDFYGNDWDGLCGTDEGGNFSADPRFCDAGAGDYTLDGESPCLPGNHPGGVDCDLIGALGHGCGVLPTGACCFPDGECTVLTSSQCADQQGTYQGDGTGCEPNPCEPTTTQHTTWGRVRGSFR